CPRHLALLHRPVGHRFLHGHDHDVAEGGIALVGAAEDPDALGLLGPRVVRYVEHGAGLDHALVRLTRSRPGRGSAGCATACPWTAAVSPRGAPGRRPCWGWSRHEP